MLLAARCASCETPGPSPCEACRGLLRPAAPEPPPAGLDDLVAVLRYDGPARGLVAGIKYGNRRQALGWLADALAGAVRASLDATPRLVRPVGSARLDAASRPLARSGHRPSAPVVVTWAPTTDAHRRGRGFDHGELLARAVARRLGVPAVRMLRRAAGPAQTGRPAHERRAGGPSFSVRRAPPPGAVVVVVDDVVTTGATLRAAARSLRDAGAARVVPAALARTPSRRG